MPAANVFAGRADIGAGFQPRGQNDPARLVEADILLHEYRIGALRHRRAGKDAHGVARLDRRLRRRAGLNASGDRKRLLGSPDRSPLRTA